MKTIQFQAPAREEINASMVHNKSVSHLDLSLGISSPNDPADHHYKNAPTTVVGKRSRMVSFQPEEDTEASPAYKKSSTVSVSSRSAFDYSYLFSNCPTGFVDPWSLAARQQKAAVEQAHLKPNPNSSSSNIGTNPETAAVAVGWPPICSSRRNLISQNSSSKFSTIYVEKDSSTLKSKTKDAGAIIRLELRPTMYVKVNMEGFSVGRKIDLSAHHSYDSLSRTLQNMFCNFLSNKLITKDSNVDDSEFILLYEDHEGDKILVGDVPWELFLTSVKRLYIARHSSAQEKASEETKEKDTTKEAAATT